MNDVVKKDILHHTMRRNRKILTNGSLLLGQVLLAVNIDRSGVRDDGSVRNGVRVLHYVQTTKGIDKA